MKSDDIDELFREAAEKYHIDTEKASAWDDVFAAVHGTGKPGPPTPPGKDNKKRWLNLLWLLLIPLGWFANNAWNNLHEKKLGKKQHTQQQAVAGTPNKTGDHKSISKQLDDNKNPGNQAADNTIPAIASNAAKTPAGAIAQANNNKYITATDDNNTAVKPAAQGAKATVQAAKTQPGNNVNQQGEVAGNAGKKQGKTIAKDNNYATQPLAANATKGAETITFNTPGTNSAGSVKPMADVPGKAESINNGENHNVAGNTMQSTDSTAKQDDKRNSKPKTGKTNKEHYFYLAMLGSPDISLIHMQKTSRVGISAGIMVGYQFNKHLGVEAGAMFDKKNYYTTGEYFDKNKIAWFSQRPDVVVHSVTGSCRMIEIPVNIRYIFTPGSKNKWYASAGVSSYLMGRESYTYDISHGSGPSYPTSVAYNNHPKNWFSIINLGAGYERSLGTKTNLRIEPYVKLPVSGVGSGNISLTSTGLYIGVTRRIP